MTTTQTTKAALFATLTSGSKVHFTTRTCGGVETNWSGCVEYTSKDVRSDKTICGRFISVQSGEVSWLALTASQIASIDGVWA
jgi:hypothetical protein